MYTYIIKSHNLYKIGKSADVAKRVKTFKTGNPVIELIKVLDGDRESDLHVQYKDKRVAGEWFELNVEDIQAIKGVEVIIDITPCDKKEKLKKVKEEKFLSNFLGVSDDKWKTVHNMTDKGYLPKNRMSLRETSIEELSNIDNYVYDEGFKWNMKYLSGKITYEEYEEFLNILSTK